jgi:reactive chlorine resistance protein C
MTAATLARIQPVARILDRVDIQSLGGSVIRYGLVAVVGWIGLMKFTRYEAEGIRPFVANSPLLSWAYWVLGVDAFSALLGAVEVAIAVLIALRPIAGGPRRSAAPWRSACSPRRSASC